MVYRRWVSIHEFRWTPIVTFTRRHLEFLDWLDENVEPIAFVEDAERIGIAIGASDLRLTIRRTGMTVESGLSDLPFSQLQDALEGAFEVLKPKATILTLSNVVSTQEVVGLEYDQARKAFATTLAATPPEVAGFSTIDASCLIDLESDEQSAQLEWGIVEASELLHRLRNPRVSRLRRKGEAAEIRESSGLSAARRKLGELPDVAVFVEMVINRLASGGVTDAQSVGDIITKVEDSARTVTLSFADRFNSAVSPAAKEGSMW